MSDTQTLQILGLFLLIVVVAFAGLARHLKVPYPILLLLAGLAISLIPHVPRVPLSPTLFFTVFLPPLLYAGAWQTNWRDFRRNLLSISMLAVGLVVFTTLGIAFFADHFISSLDFRSGFLLGAVVAATDAVAATSIARSLGLSPRITSILEGESLLNDATGLLALEFGIALLLGEQTPSLGGSFLRLLWLIAGGVGVGLLLGKLTTYVERWVDEGSLEMAISLIVPYVAYLAAEEAKASGVLAVVACGLFLSRHSAEYLTAPARLEILSAWKALDFILNGFVFLLLGLQLPYILAGIHDYSFLQLIKYGASFSVVLIALRLLWVYPGAYVSMLIRRHLFHQTVPTPDTKSIFVVGWTGMRGVLSLAAAFSLPETLSNGQPFQQRNLILFLTFSIIFVTLVLQGLSLPALIRRLGLAGNREAEDEELAARRTILQRAVAALQLQLEDATPDDAHDIEDMLDRYNHRLDAILASAHSETNDAKAAAMSEEEKARHLRRVALQRETVDVERAVLLQLRDEGAVGDEVLRRLERELDLTESAYEARFGAKT